MPNVAAATLLIAMIVAMVGTICQADPVSPSCEAHPCAAASLFETPPSNSWQASLELALLRTERGFQQMAGLPPSR